MDFRVAAIDPEVKKKGSNEPMKRDPRAHIPWLFSNESGYALGANVSSRTGLMTCDEKRVLGWRIQMTRSDSGHWMFPIIQAFIDLSTPSSSRKFQGSTQKMHLTEETQTALEVTQTQRNDSPEPPREDLEGQTAPAGAAK